MNKKRTPPTATATTAPAWIPRAEVGEKTLEQHMREMLAGIASLMGSITTQLTTMEIHIRETKEAQANIAEDVAYLRKWHDEEPRNDLRS